MKILSVLLTIALCGIAHGQSPPATVTRNLTNNGTTLTVNFTLHPIRESPYTVLTQGADGVFTPVTPDVPRTYIGTVVGRPGAIAAGYQKANGTFWSHVILEDGSSWSSTGTAASVSGGSTTPTVYPTTGVGTGGSGAVVRAAYLGVDSSYRHYLAAGSTVAGVVDIVEYSVMKANLVYLRDVGILHRVGRIAIRTSAAKCPYEPISSSDWSALLNKTRDQWNSALSGPEDIVVMVKPAVGGGLAFVGTIGTVSNCAISGSNSDGDFSQVWRHEAGHNWGSSHFEGGGKPEGQTIMSDNALGRFSSSEAAKIISHRASKTGILANLGGYPFPLPPRVFGDRVTMTSGSIATTIDVLANDSDSNGEAISLLSSDGASNRRALVVRSAGTGPTGRDQITYYAPPNYSTGFDYFNYRIQDSAGYQGVGKAYINPVALPPLPPQWTSSDVGTVGTAGEVGSAEGSYVSYASGADIWSTSDAFRYTRLNTKGDCDIRARVSAQMNTAPWAKAGVMIRESDAPGSAHAMMAVTPGNGFSFLYRSTTGGTSFNVVGPALNAFPNNWVRLKRSGNLFTAYVSANGTTWTQVGNPVNIAMSASVTAGLATNSAAGTTLGGAAFDNVSLADGTALVQLLEDTFESGGTAGNDAADPLDTDWTGIGGSVSVMPDTTIGTGQALNFDAAFSLAYITGSFAGRSLIKEGEKLSLEFDFRYTQNPANTTAGFRFGLFDADGDGFGCLHGTGGNTDYAVIEGAGGFGAGNTNNLASGTKASINNQAAHKASLVLLKTATGVRVTVAVDGIELSALDTTSPVTTFQNVVVRNGNLNADFHVDNVRVNFSQPVTPVFVSNPIVLSEAAVGLNYFSSLSDQVSNFDSTYTFSKTSGPSWLQIAADGSITGNPSAANVGMNSFVVRVTNPGGDFAEATVRIDVAAEVASLYWDGTGTSWNNVSSWSSAAGATVPDPAQVPGISDRAVFNRASLNTPQTVGLDSNQSAVGLLLNSTGSVSLQGGGSNRLLGIGSGGITSVSGAGSLTIGSATAGQQVAVSLLTPQTWSNVTGTTTINNNVTGIDTNLTLLGNHSFRAGGSVLNIGTGTLNYSGSVLELQNNNNVMGGAILRKGEIYARHANSFGSVGAITLGDSTGTAAATLRLGSITMTRPIALAAGGNLQINNIGFASSVFTGGVTGTNNLTLSSIISGTGSATFSSNTGALDQVGTLTLQNAGNGTNAATSGILAINSAITSNVKSVTIQDVTTGTRGAQKVVFGSSANAYTGDTVIPSGTLQLGIASAIPDGAGKGNLQLNGTLDLNAKNETINGLFGTGTVDNTFEGAAVLTVGGNNRTGAFNGILKNTAGTLALVKIGGGTLTLAGANTHSGGTTVAGNGGTLLITNPAAFGTGPVTISKGATQTGTLALNLEGSNIISNTVTGFGSTTFTGAGTPPCILNLGGDNTITSNLTITGVGGDGLAIKSDAGLLTLTGTIGQTVGTIRGLQLNGTGEGLVTGNILSGTGGFSLVKDGTGTWTLTGSNTYQSGTTISQGTLRIGNGGISGTLGSGNVINNGSLVIDRLNEVILSNAISGTGNFIQAGSGITTLTGENTYLGDTTVDAGELLLGSPFLNDAADVMLATGSTLRLTHGGTDTIDELFIDGFRQETGTWGALGSGAEHETDLISGTGKLLVSIGEAVAVSTYMSWISFHELEGLDAETTGDPDSDGLVNLIEYALGTNPTFRTPAPVAVTEGNLLTMTYTRNLEATDIVLTPEWSPDLGTWHQEDISLETLDEVDGIRTIKASLPLDGSGKLFLRLRVTQIENP